MNLDALRTYGRLAFRLAALIAVVGGVLVLGMLGWQWQVTAPVERVAVTGTRHAPPDTLRRLARVDSGMVMSAIDARLVSDRVTRHPWVRSVDVEKRRASRILELAVTERTPAGLVVDASGRPAFYVDAEGYAMPLPDSTGYDVPLIRGLAADYHPIQRVVPPALRSVLPVLQTADAASLVGSVTVRADSSLYLTTTPIGAHGALPVRIGAGSVAQKLKRLQAFAQQVLATQPEAAIAQIDLRFDGQIITREHPLDG